MKNKKSAKLLVTMLSLSILLSALAVASTGAQAVLTASDTAFSIGDKFTLQGSSSMGGETYNMTWAVVGEETVGGLQCSVVDINYTYSNQNQNINSTVWIPKAYITKNPIRSKGMDSETTYAISGMVSTIKAGDSWSEIVSAKTIYTDPTNSSNINTYYGNYTQNYTILSDSAAVTVPAGTITCYVINSSMNYSSNYYSDYYYTVMYRSGKWIVKSEGYVRNYTTGVFELSSTNVLVSYSGASETSKSSSNKGFVPGFETVASIGMVITFAIVTRKKFLS